MQKHHSSRSGMLHSIDSMQALGVASSPRVFSSLPMWGTSSTSQRWYGGSRCAKCPLPRMSLECVSFYDLTAGRCRGGYVLQDNITRSGWRFRAALVPLWFMHIFRRTPDAYVRGNIEWFDKWNILLKHQMELHKSNVTNTSSGACGKIKYNRKTKNFETDYGWLLKGANQAAGVTGGAVDAGWVNEHLSSCTLKFISAQSTKWVAKLL